MNAELTADAKFGAAADAGADQARCYHCGLPMPEDADFPVEIRGVRREMCCVGCQAVAQAIVENGLEDYYTSRDAMPESPREAVPAVLEQLQLFDHAEFQKSFVRELDEHEREASLMLEGITCAACVWLNERHVGQLPGVTGIDVNYANRRARVRWDNSRIRLSDILSAISAIGYRAYPYDATRHEELARKERRDALWRVWVAGFGMMQVMMYAIPVYIAGEGEMPVDIETLIRWASLFLTLPVVFYSSSPFFKGAWRDMKLRRVGMDVPVALGIGVAFIASVWATLTQSGEVYFDSVAMFVFFLLGGRYLEMTARQKAVSVSEALAKLLPAFCLRLPGFPANREPEQVVVSDLRPGDVVLVRPGDTIPADGRVLEGQGNANEALLTGESRPVAKQTGDSVTGGSLNMESPLFIQVEKVGEETRLSAIIRLMERAAAEKPRVVEMADRIAQWFVACLLFFSVLVALGWYVVDPARALWITVSVLVVTCPCALALATPISLTVAAGALARDGVLVTRGHAVETLARATHFVFDKTGTLTRGEMSLLDVAVLRGNRAEALALAAALEGASEHPLALAIRRAAGEGERPLVEHLRAEAGMGLEGVVAGRRLRIGRPDYVAALAPEAFWHWPEGWRDSGDTIVLLGDERGGVAFFRIGDEVRPEAGELVADLQAAGCQVVLMSGDAEPVALRVGRALGIADVRAAMSPQAKRDAVQALQEAGAVVAMVGDGVNDAPVLAQAQVSVAMGTGAELARTQADLLLLSENLRHLRRGVRRCRFAMRVIRQNLLWSFSYNFLALPLAALGHVTPWAAGIGMSASSLLVVMNALRIQRKDV
ncbi:heavy metal translocating P-type ATPase [Azovibrio restrictus]|uniref:heavy metal translocating P-type ATPase n=1 Tax=Azovibrio restrictus TaxID=146938 RepID=UPI0026F1695E|nr:heavy metal translocating P-type ATPase [Azovibrio restrictus]